MTVLKRIAPYLLSVTLWPLVGHSAELHYDYVDVGLSLYPSADSQTWLGPKVRGSMAINEDVFVFGEFSYLTDDVDLTNLVAGGAYRFELDPKTDLWGGVGLSYSNVSAPRVCEPISGVCYSTSHNDTALGLFGGLRHQKNSDLELAGTLRMITGDFDYVGLTGTARYAMDENWTLVADLDLFDGDLGVFGGVHFRF